MGVTRPALLATFHTFRAVGAKFSLEMLSKVEGRRVDVAVKTSGATRRDRPGWDDVRHLKRLADHRWGNASRLLQFCFVGASGAVVDLFCYWLFQKLFGATSLANYVVYPTQVRWSLAAAGSLGDPGRAALELHAQPPADVQLRPGRVASASSARPTSRATCPA